MHWDPDKEVAYDLEGGIHLAILKLIVHIIPTIKCCRRELRVCTLTLWLPLSSLCY
jgi:hypothetical protein